MPDPEVHTPVLPYLSLRAAPWPEAEFIGGNPHFIGIAAMRAALGDDYTEALCRTYLTCKFDDYVK